MSWWKQNRKSLAIQSIEESICLFSESNFDAALFVKEKKVNHESTRSNFLKNIGGQNHVFCEKHKIPFITCDSNNVWKCCGIINDCNCCKKYFCAV